MVQYLNIIQTAKNAKLWVKLSAIVVLMILPFVSLLTLFVRDQNKIVAVTQQEREGVEYLTPLPGLINAIPKHRGLMASQTGKELVSGLRANIDSAFKQLEALDQRLGRRLQSTEKFQTLSRQWQDLRQRVDGLTPEESFEQHTQMMAQAISLLDHVADASTLVLDPEAITYYLMNLGIYVFPELIESVGIVRGTGTGVLSRQVVTLEEQARLGVLLHNVQKNVETLYRGTERIYKAAPELEKPLAALLNPVFELIDRFVTMTQEQIIKADNISLSPKEYFAQGTEVTESLDKLYTTVFKELETRLLARFQAEKSHRTQQIVLAVGLLALALALAYWVTRLITGQANALFAMFSEIGMGNYEARATVQSEDEIGQMTGLLNTMVESILTLNKTVEEERDGLQNSLMKLLEEVSEVASGDLTVQAEVTADAAGALADSFNYMILQLREVVTRVQEATLHVSSSASEIQTTAEHLADGSESQASQIVDSSAAIDEMAVSIQQVSDNAVVSANVAEQALQNAKQGAQAVQNTIEGMNRIRDQVQETSKRIKRLGERSQEIGEIVQLIGDIADRTSILALNASIQAARAGEAGRAFVVVAEEVERLADRSSAATKQIASLVNTIQSETNEAVTAMEESTREVVGGSQLADQAGQTLAEIEGVSNRLAELIQSISLASKQQARGSEGLSKAMGEISEVTQQTAAGTKQAAVSINNLAVLADDLRQSVSAFKLPSNGHRP